MTVVAAEAVESRNPATSEVVFTAPAAGPADADLEHAADCIIAAGTAINGQKCTATRRVLVHTTVAETLQVALAGRVRAITSGDPMRDDVDLGPLVHPQAAERAEQAVDEAVARGARVVARSAAPADPALPPEAFFSATVLTDLAPDEPLRRHELFAPVLSVETFDSAGSAWRLANATPFGLTASVYTADPATAAAAARALCTGVVAVNRRGDALDIAAPFVGTKDSGNGHPRRRGVRLFLPDDPAGPLPGHPRQHKVITRCRFPRPRGSSSSAPASTDSRQHGISPGN
jgi:acyl-CoA reductase-like NAD-dependent aldehyde dehydrogenase